MVCVILAAGKNVRLDNGMPKSLLRVNHHSLLERHIRLFHKVGIKQFCIVVGYRGNMIEDFAVELGAKYDVQIDFVHNEHYELENGYSLLAAREWIEQHKVEEFFFTMADHYYDLPFLEEAKKLTPFENGQLLKLAVDQPGEHNDHIDIDDVTKVKVGERIENIGKKITEFNFYDTGLFFVKSAIYTYFNDIKPPKKCSISALVQQLGDEGKAVTMNLTGHFWSDIDTPQDLANTKVLIEKIHTAPFT